MLEVKNLGNQPPVLVSPERPEDQKHLSETSAETGGRVMFLPVQTDLK